MFSPNNDGVGDVLIILQADGTVEKEWKGLFKNSSGEIVKTFTWTDSAPGDVLWDGTDDDGKILPDGKYSYEIQTADLAGNKSQKYQIKGIEVDGMSPLLVIELESPSFSPNADGVKDELVLTPVYELVDEITDWSWSLADNSGVVLQQKGNAADGPA